MDKITFISSRYGPQVNGGAEVHCRMLAERLTSLYEVEVLTTGIKNYSTYEQIYPIGTEIINGVKVIRFPTSTFNKSKYENLRKKTKFARKLRRIIFRMNLSKFIYKFFPVWNIGAKKEYELLKSQGFYSEPLLQYLNSHKSESKVYILFSYAYPLAHFGSMLVADKSILIPTAHEESEFFRSINSQLFSRVSHIAFNTESEQKLSATLFNKGMAPNTIISVGTNLKYGETDENVIEKFNLHTNYILYFGRVCNSKMNNLIPYFLAYKQNYPSDLALVLTGEIYTEKVIHPEIYYTGFVSELEKNELIQKSIFIVNPSRNESLSLLLIEAMELGKTVLVNDHCEVMREHCKKSNGAAVSYKSKKEFCKQLNYLYSHPEVLNSNSLNAKKYVKDNYDWEIIMKRLVNLIGQY